MHNASSSLLMIPYLKRYSEVRGGVARATIQEFPKKNLHEKLLNNINVCKMNTKGTLLEWLSCMPMKCDSSPYWSYLLILFYDNVHQERKQDKAALPLRNLNSRRRRRDKAGYSGFHEFNWCHPRMQILAPLLF